jgi:hypothetical protein
MQAAQSAAFCIVADARLRNGKLQTVRKKRVSTKYPSKVTPAVLMPVYFHGVGAREDCFGKYHTTDALARFWLLEEDDSAEFEGKPRQG